jgi:hypothetical protein
MATTELDQEIEERGAVTSAQTSLQVTASAQTSASPDQVLAAAYDFSERRAQIWRNVKVKRLEVHDHSDTWAEVTEGTMLLGVFWERCRYDWSEPGTVTATVLDSNIFRPGSTFELRAIPRTDGGSAVEMIVARNFRNGVKGTIARSINHIGGRRVFGLYLRTTLEAIERTSANNVRTRSGCATRERDSLTIPASRKPRIGELPDATPMGASGRFKAGLDADDRSCGSPDRSRPDTCVQTRSRLARSAKTARARLSSRSWRGATRDPRGSRTPT